MNFKVKRSTAIASLQPTADFCLVGGAITTWVCSNPKPSDSEIEAEQARLQTIYDNEKYKRDRADEYPSVVDQLDDIYHNGIDAWKATIKTTKDKYPKS